MAIIGGGPIGLAALAHLLEREQPALLFEAGGSIAANVQDWGHVRMFSPWRYNIDAAGRRLLEASGWEAPPADELPTGAELVQRYLLPLAELPGMSARIQTGARVTAISRRHHDKLKDRGRDSSPFQLLVKTRRGESLQEARAVIDATGSWHNPNPMGGGGLPAFGERLLRRRIRYGIPDILNRERERYAGKSALVVGSGHSASNALLDLLRLKAEVHSTRVIWAMRGDNLRRVYGGGESDALPARGQLGMSLRAAVEAGELEIAAPFLINGIEGRGEALLVSGEGPGGAKRILADEIIACTGARPDLRMLGELRLDLDPALESSRALAPLIDPNLHSCGTVPPHGVAELRQPEKGLYLVGAKSYGRAPNFLLATGYEQVRSVAAALAGDWAAARDLQLQLPETGVCITDLAESCCGPLEPALIAIDEITPVALCC